MFEITIKISDVFGEIGPELVIACQAELGPNCAKITWDNAMRLAETLAVPETFYPEMRDYVRGYGAWSADEIATWSDQELRAFALQEIAAELREMARDSYDPEDSLGRVFLHEDADTLTYYIGF